MTKGAEKKQAPPKKEGGNLIPALSSALGTIILLAVILSALPLAVPKILGYEIFSIVSGSMEPTLPVGSVVYVEHCAVSEVRPGEIIAFRDDDTVVTHRVIETRPQEGAFITKGDANESTDIQPTPYWELIGRVKMCIPILGKLLALYSSREGKIVLVFFAMSGLLFRMIASRMKAQLERDRAKKAARERGSGKDETM